MDGATSTELPSAWWLFWWLVGVVSTGMLVAWFLRGSRRAHRDADPGPGADDAPGAGEPHAGSSADLEA